MEAERMAGFAKRKMLNESLESWGEQTGSFQVEGSKSSRSRR